MMSRPRHSQFYCLMPLMFLLCLAASALTGDASEYPNRDSVSDMRRDADTAADDALAPAFTPTPDLTSGVQLLYTQQFPEARQKFTAWESEHPQEPFGEVAL